MAVTWTENQLPANLDIELSLGLFRGQHPLNFSSAILKLLSNCHYFQIQDKSNLQSTVLDKMETMKGEFREKRFASMFY